MLITELLNSAVEAVVDLNQPHAAPPGWYSEGHGLSGSILFHWHWSRWYEARSFGVVLLSKWPKERETDMPSLLH
ncbi:MAG: hypothetical protein R3E67_05545 [Pseudomonadales bacterium]